jgi:hypothetical protein
MGPALSSIRNPITAELQFILQQNHNIQYNTLSNDDKLQIILDCTHLIKSPRKIDVLLLYRMYNTLTTAS